MSEFIPQTKWQAIGMIVVAGSQLIIEYWLGKTDKTKASSILDAIILFLQTLKNSIKR